LTLAALQTLGIPSAYSAGMLGRSEGGWRKKKELDVLPPRSFTATEAFTRVPKRLARVI
jgi:hypothetical protein